MDPRRRAFSSRRAVYGDQLNDGVIDHGKAVLLFLPDENSLGSVCVRRAFDRSSFFAFVKRDTRNSLEQSSCCVIPPLFFFFLLRNHAKNHHIIVSLVKRINKRVVPLNRDKSNRARSYDYLEWFHAQLFLFISFFFFFFSLLDTVESCTDWTGTCDYTHIFVVRLYRNRKSSSHEVAGRLDSHGRGLFEGAH